MRHCQRVISPLIDRGRSCSLYKVHIIYSQLTAPYPLAQSCSQYPSHQSDKQHYPPCPCRYNLFYSSTSFNPPYVTSTNIRETRSLTSPFNSFSASEQRQRISFCARVMQYACYGHSQTISLPQNPQQRLINPPPNQQHFSSNHSR